MMSALVMPCLTGHMAMGYGRDPLKLRAKVNLPPLCQVIYPNDAELS